MSKSVSTPSVCRALRLRDLALPILWQQGTWEQFGKAKILTARHSTILLAYRTPFQRISHVSDAFKYKAAQLRQNVPSNLPYGLDIWAPKKVLNMEWDEQGNVALVSFRPGEWEAQLAAG
jgi:hypothetical protein